MQTNIGIKTNTEDNSNFMLDQFGVTDKFSNQAKNAESSNANNNSNSAQRLKVLGLDDGQTIT